VRTALLDDDDTEQIALDRARALATIERWRRRADGFPLEGLVARIVPSERERDALAEAAASLYAKRRARARRRAATS
jgi:hypothetical protein